MRRLLLALLLVGCAGGPHGINPDRETVKPGVIESATPIVMDASTSAGSLTGGIFGQVGGASSGAGRGAVAGSVLGGVPGGTLGNQAGIATRPGLELWIRLDNEDQSTYVMQPGNPDAFKVGDRVRVTYKRGEAHVELDTQPAAK